MPRSSTQTISIDAPPEVVLNLVADPLALPTWAPKFASAIRPDGTDWIVDTGQGEIRINVRVSRELGTVDFLAAGLPPGTEIGAFSRVVRNGSGSEYMFTQFFADDAHEADIEEQKATVAEELLAVRTLCTPGETPPGAGSPSPTAR
jgi:Polyketide cyclase / dehydrase and lipid transport